MNYYYYQGMLLTRVTACDQSRLSIQKQSAKKTDSQIGQTSRTSDLVAKGKVISSLFVLIRMRDRFMVTATCFQKLVRSCIFYRRKSVIS